MTAPTTSNSEHATQQQEPPFTKVLVANRGEIAIRVFRTLRELGITSVAVYSDADRQALHTTYADEAWAIGGQLPSESYLLIERILDVAARSGAEAVHPGYGFLAENAQFARACEDAGIVFIGPSPDSIERMGSKTASRELMRAAGVPIVPGTTEPITTLEGARETAAEVGYPVAVKARSGGGGKGFRVALDEQELPAAFEGASREGERYFGDGAVYLERYLHDPRHVEVQVLGDQHGSVIHLGERDCTIQRRHQKLVEECPSPVASDALRAQLGEIAIGAARAVDYRGAGTIECLLDAEGNAYFLEMNTRVQVEHTVTEEVTGIDIVAEQLWIAAGQPLRVRQEDVVLRGHAIEVRINAEDARADFLPSSGTVTRYREPSGIGVRVDSGVAEGVTVSPFYDTLLSKLIVWGPDRESARRRMLRALDEYEIGGLQTLVPFHRALLATDGFAAATSCREVVADPARFMEEPQGAEGAGDGIATPAAPVRPERHVVEVDGRRFTVDLYPPADEVMVPPPVRSRRGGAAAGPGDVVAPIPGNVLQVLVEPGQQVEAGQLLCVLEAMKMENEIAAPASGVVGGIAVSAGDAVGAGQPLMRIEPA